jgi:hypothetical protein
MIILLSNESSLSARVDVIVIPIVSLTSTTCRLGLQQSSGLRAVPEQTQRHRLVQPEMDSLPQDRRCPVPEKYWTKVLLAGLKVQCHSDWYVDYFQYWPNLTGRMSRVLLQEGR